MSRTGRSYDNAVTERFFWSAKHEWTKFESLADIQDARLSILRYIETYYNTDRIRQWLGYLTPNQFETQHKSALVA